MFYNTLTKNGNYPIANIQFKNGELKTIENVQFYWSGKKFIDFYCYDSVNKKDLDNVSIRAEEITFIQWKF